MLGLTSLLSAPDRRPPADPQSVHKAQLGQFMTPPSVAIHMASQFDSVRMKHVSLLDAGAGEGALSAAFANRWRERAPAGATLSIDAYEIDPSIAERLQARFVELDRLPGITTGLHQADFIANAASLIARGERPFTHAILNPPYKKISSDSEARRLLSGVGIETVNLYSGFVALALKLLKDQGELVAIIPRSFCNGPYYRPFRKLVLADSAIVSLHLFKARDKAFATDKVLQENVILRLKRGAAQSEVAISTSTDASFSDLNAHVVPFDKVVQGDDAAKVIHIPTDAHGAALSGSTIYRTALADLRLQVSTGPVVDFRVKQFLRDIPGARDVPLLYPTHFTGGRFEWPRLGGRKPNALALTAATARLLLPVGHYVVVRRFSSKEERRRVVASVVEPAALPTGWIGFENHLNVYHSGKKPLPATLARGLATYLNSQLVDDWLRSFSGLTQVNATDLRTLPMPSEPRLQQLGRWSEAHRSATQEEIDAIVETP